MLMLVRTSKFTNCIWQDNTKQARVLYLHCGPLKEKKGLGDSKNSFD